MYKKIIFFLLLSFSILNSRTINLYDIKEYKITEEKIVYKITAESKNINLKKLKKFKFYNKEKVIAESSYYLNGNLSTKELEIDFSKGYFLEGNFIMYALIGRYKNIKFKAEKAIFTKKRLKLDKVFIISDDKKYRKIKYTLEINN